MAEHTPVMGLTAMIQSDCGEWGILEREGGLRELVQTSAEGLKSVVVVVVVSQRSLVAADIMLGLALARAPAQRHDGNGSQEKGDNSICAF